MKPKHDAVLWITGASSGIGEAVAREWVAQRGRVAMLARRTERLEALATELGGPARALALACDVTREGDCEKAAEATVARFGAIDYAFANAGFGVSGEFEIMKLEDYSRQFQTNVFGVLRTARAAFPHLQKSGGAFSVNGSVLSHIALPGGTPYAMSKFAVRAFTEGLRPEWARHGVGVTLINPGFVATEIRRVDNQGTYHPERKEPVPEWLIVPSDIAAREIVAALVARVGERNVTGHAKFLVWMNRFLPGVLKKYIIPRFATPPNRAGWTRE